MEEKLELKHLAPYLPYKLKITFEGDEHEHELVGLDVTSNGVKLLSPFNDYGSSSLEASKPLLHPLSRLTDKQKKFLYFEVISIDNDMYGNLDEFIDYLNETSEYHLPYCIYRQFIEWHYDVFGLIEKGLALPIDPK